MWHDRLPAGYPREHPARSGRDRFACRLDELDRQTSMRHGAEELAIKAEETSERGLAQAHRLFQHRVEHRGKVAGRGIDDL